jgi:hypothetical protein
VEGNRLYRLSVRHPILVPIVLLFIAAALRIVDIFFLPLAEALGEAILHKALGFTVILVYVWAAGRSLRAIGLHGRLIGKALFVGAGGIAAVFLLAFGSQWTAASTAGVQPKLLFSAIDPQTGLAGGLSFALVLVAGNLVNSFAEEGLFPGAPRPMGSEPPAGGDFWSLASGLAGSPSTHGTGNPGRQRFPGRGDHFRVDHRWIGLRLPVSQDGQLVGSVDRALGQTLPIAPGQTLEYGRWSRESLTPFAISAPAGELRGIIPLRVRAPPTV